MLLLNLRRKINKNAYIVIRTRGDGAKRLYRSVDFRGDLQLYLPSLFLCYVNDPCRTAFLGLFIFLNGVLSYRIGTHKMSPLTLFSFNNDEFGNVRNGALNYLSFFKGGSFFHSMPLIKGSRAVFARTAGIYLSLLRNDLQSRLSYVRVRKNLTLVCDIETLVTSGRVCNILHYEFKEGKAGIRRLNGFRPIVRGVAMNPVDHPNGGRTPGGKVYRSFSNKIARSTLKTRSKYRVYNSYISRA